MNRPVISPEARATFRASVRDSGPISASVAAVLAQYAFDIRSLADLFGELGPLTQTDLFEIHEAYCQVRKLPMPDHFLNDCVRTSTAKDGIVECSVTGLTWHHELERWHYSLQVKGGRKLSRRFEADELAKS